MILGKTNIPAFSHDGARANTSWDGPTYNAVNRDIAPGSERVFLEVRDKDSGLVLERLGRLPDIGDAVDVAGVRITVLAMEKRRIARLRVERLPMI